jgi:hypothetical protein
MERMERLIKALLILLVLPSLAWGAELIFSENFDDQTLNSPWVIRRYGYSAATLGHYAWVAGHGTGANDGSGYALGSGTIYPIWAEWTPGTTIGDGDEVYVSWWMKYPDGCGAIAGHYFKFFYAYFNGVEDKIEMSQNNTTNAFYLLYNNGSLLQDEGGSDAFGYPSSTPGTTWHHYEVWWKFSTSEYKFWLDRPSGDYTSEATTTTPGTYLLVYRNLPDNAWGGGSSRVVNTLNAGSMQNDMGEDAQGNTRRYIDDIEVWDGIPDSTPAPAPPIISNCTISNGRVQ